ncbi:hypothetical protein GQ457_02G013190 [Hibiscus cannabinus]
MDLKKEYGSKFQSNVRLWVLFNGIAPRLRYRRVVERNPRCYFRLLRLLKYHTVHLVHWALGAGAGLGVSMFPGLGLGGLGGSAGLFEAGLPDFEQLQQQLARNPNIVRELMNVPAVRNLMNDPGMIRNLIMNNPQFAELVDRNPELAHILNDPLALHRTLEAARNPELMRVMMRNTDRAMSNIESSPEGFNMLRHVYEIVQVPFLNATTFGWDYWKWWCRPICCHPKEGTKSEMDQLTSPPQLLELLLIHQLLIQIHYQSRGGSQTNTARSDPSADFRSQAPVGLGGLGLPSFEGLFGAMQDTESVDAKSSSFTNDANPPVQSSIHESDLIIRLRLT